MILYHPERILVEYTDADLELFRGQAQEREDAKIDGICADKRYGVGGVPVYGNVQTHFIGLLGENAFGPRFSGLPVDESVGLSGPAIDFVWYGTTIEVKTLQGFLVFNKPENFKADVAVLVTHKKNKYHKVWLEGWTTRETFLDTYFLHDFGYGERLCKQPAHLFSMHELEGYCRRRSIRASTG